MPYDRQGTLTVRTPLNTKPVFPKRPHNSAGYRDWFNVIFAVQVPDGCDMIDLFAQVKVQVKNPTAKPPYFLMDSRPGREGEYAGAFCDVECWLSDQKPADTDTPKGRRISINSGENMLNPLIRPYWECFRFACAVDVQPGQWVTLYVSPRSEACWFPQYVVIAKGDSYNMLSLVLWKKR